MKVFISWSGNQSQALGKVLRDWLPSVIQALKPYFSPDDIEKGTRWSGEIANELRETLFGLICLTKDNLNKPWLLFEAGALSKSVEEGHVCAVLFDIEPSDVKSPLSQFQLTNFTKEDFLKLLTTLNNRLGENQLTDAILEQVFNKWWPDLEKKVKSIIENVPVDESTITQRDNSDILKEILENTRISSKRLSLFSKMILRTLDPAGKYSGTGNDYKGMDTGRELYQNEEQKDKAITDPEMLQAIGEISNKINK